MAAEFAHLSLVGPLEGFDDPAKTETLATRLLAQNRNLTGIYNLGAGNSGLRAALLVHQGPRPRAIVHELTPTSRLGLAEASFDLVLDQNPAGEIRAAIAAARALALGAAPASEPIGIGIFLRDNLG
jgi:LacI family transcriptional regulator